MSAKILVVDDDQALSEMIGIILESSAYEPSFCADGAKAVDKFREVEPDLLLLDLMLPGMDGIEICRRIREFSNVPIIMLTAKSDTTDVVAGLEAGADDYIPKPFKPKELLARVAARLRNLEAAEHDILKAAGVEINLASHEVSRDGKPLNLTPLQYDLLVTLATKPGRVFSREELLEQVWGLRHASDTRLVNVHVQRLRAKVELDPDNPTVVLTVRGVGYRIGTEPQ